MAVAAAVINSDPTAITVDLQDARGVEFILSIGIGGITFSGTNKIEFVLQESDDDATYTDVADADVLGMTVASDGIVKALTSAHATAAVYRFGYRGTKRYLQLTPDFSGTHGTGTPIAAVAMIDGRQNPQDAQA